MKKHLFFPLLLSGLFFLLSSCASEYTQVFPGLTGTNWEYFETEQSNGIEYKYTTHIRFAKDELTVYQFLRKDGELSGIAEGTFIYLFDGETVQFQITYGDKARNQQVELQLEENGTRLIWREDGAYIATLVKL